MENKFRIDIFGFMEDTNIGDPVIVDTCEYLTKIICNENAIDANISKHPLFPPPDYTKYWITCFLRKRCRKNRGNFGLWFTYLVFRLYLLLPFNIFSRYYKPIIKKSKCVIFAGGGMLKYISQEFWAADYCIIKYCKKYNIPVYFNAIGIEGYDKNHLYSRIISNLLKSNCIKNITTRDDIDSLKKYKSDISNDSIVGDPALWSSSLYHRKPTLDLIGIGTIRSGIFTVNGRMITEDNLISFYIAMIERLKKHNQKWQLFTNGTDADYNLGLKILKELNIKPNNEIIAPQPKTAQELINLITQYKGIIANRMHAHIIAASYGIPTVGLIWNDKIKQFAKHLGIEERFFNCDKINDYDEIFSVFEEIMLKNNIEDDVEKLKNKTKEHLSKFLTNLYADWEKKK